MKKVLIVCVFSAILSHSGVPTVYAQNNDYSASLASNYGAYEYEESSYIPKRISKLKIISFPFMVLAAPIVFPGYYAHTKEPDLKHSFRNYWRWIHYEVPYTLGDGINEAIEKPDYTSRFMEKQKEADTIGRESYVDEFEDRYKRLHPTTTEMSDSDHGFEQTEIEEAVPELTRREKKIQRYMQRAESAYAEGKLDKAQKYYKRILNIEPSHEIAFSMHDKITAHLDREKTAASSSASASELYETEKVDDIASISKDLAHETSDSENQSPKKSQRTSFWSRFLGLFKKNNDEISSDQKQDDREMSKEKELLSAVDKTYTEQEPGRQEEGLESRDLDQNHLLNGEKGLFTQTTLVPTKKRVVRIPPSVDPQSKSVLDIPLDAKTTKRIEKMLKKGEKQYRRENFDKALQYYFQVLQLDIRNEQAQKMVRTITDIQRSHEMQKTLTSIQ